jgi:hypothetical protein
LKRPRKRTLQQSDNNGSKTSSKSNDPRGSVETSSKTPEIPPALETTLDTSEGYAEAGALSGNGVNSMETAPDPRANIHDLSFILHPAHEAASPENKEATPPDTTCRELHCTKFEQACVALGVTVTSLGTMYRLLFYIIRLMVLLTQFQSQHLLRQHGCDKPFPRAEIRPAGA